MPNLINKSNLIIWIVTEKDFSSVYSVTSVLKLVWDGGVDYKRLFVCVRAHARTHTHKYMQPNVKEWNIMPQHIVIIEHCYIMCILGSNW